MLASFERRRFDRVTRPEPAGQKRLNSTVKCKHFLAVLFCFASIFGENCVEKYKEFNGVNFSSTRVRTKVLASFENQGFMLRVETRKHYVFFRF